MKLNIRVVESEPFGENAYLAWLDGSTAAFVVDPGFDTEAIVEHLRRESLDLVAILNTHGHVDHIAGNAELKRLYPDAPILIGPGDAPMLTDPELNLSAKWGYHIVSPPADRLVLHGERLDIAGMLLEVREIPGHSPGHIVYVAELPTKRIVFGGDVLFAGSVGRTDFPNGSFPLLAEGIRSQLWTLPDDTRVLPGHGPTTTIGEEKQTNPFVGIAASRS